MLDLLWESGDRAPSKGNAKRKHGPKPSKRARVGLGLEHLERRDVPAVLFEVGDAPPVPDSDFMQAACTSASFLQVSMNTIGQPTSSPGISTGGNAREPAAEPPHVLWRGPTPLSEHIAMDAVGPSTASPFKLLPAMPSLRNGAGGINRLEPSDSTWPPHVFAPYVEMGVWPQFDLVEAAATQGIRHFNLAFITADSQNRPSWAGNDLHAINGNGFDLSLRDQIAELRAMGGDVAVSFGGPKGVELAQAITNVADLKAAYRTVVDAYGLKRIDVDIDGAALVDTASVERRSQALAGLQSDLVAEGRSLEVWLTLPAQPSGLSEVALNVVRSAERNGVHLGGVNAKTMNFGPQAAAGADGKMGLHAIQSGINLFYQLHRVLGAEQESAEVWSKVGVTPMIGQNDVVGERFLPADAELLRDFASQQGLGMVGIWSLNRDQASEQTSQDVEATTSGIPQTAFEFSKIFLPFGDAPSK